MLKAVEMRYANRFIGMNKKKKCIYVYIFKEVNGENKTTQTKKREKRKKRKSWILIIPNYLECEGIDFEKTLKYSGYFIYY